VCLKSHTCVIEAPKGSKYYQGGSKMAEIILVSTTLEKLDKAEAIARKLLDKRIVACAQISGPIKSYYRWKEATVEAEEFVLAIKTTPSLQQRVVDLIIQMHPYELPEIITQTPDYVLPEYANWVYGECNGE